MVDSILSGSILGIGPVRMLTVMNYGEYGDKCVLVTGGLGFIGSNLVIRLVELGARVTIVDSLVPGCGGNRANLDSVIGAVQIKLADIRDVESLAAELQRPDIVFNLAGAVSHSGSMEAPLRDLELNTWAQLVFLSKCADHFPGVRIVYAGTRQVYGVPQCLPVTEDHPIAPVDFNGVHKFAASAYHLLLAKLGRLDAVVLRLTNVYGPHMALNVKGQGFLTVYVRNALAGEPIEIHGNGRQLRDPVHVTDVVDAFLAAGLRSFGSRVFNISGPDALEIRQIAKIAAAAGRCEIICREFGPLEKAIDIGSYRAEASRVRSELKWRPRTRFEQGFVETLQSYDPRRYVRGEEQPRSLVCIPAGDAL